MRKLSTITFTSKNRTPGNFDRAGFSWHSRTFLAVCWMLALGPFSREKHSPRVSCAGQGWGRHSLAKQNLVCTQALLIYCPSKFVQVQKGAQGRLRAGVTVPSFGQEARQGEPQTAHSGNELCWGCSPGLSPRPDCSWERRQPQYQLQDMPIHTLRNSKERLFLLKERATVISLWQTSLRLDQQNPILHRNYMGEPLSLRGFQRPKSISKFRVKVYLAIR